jgi:hypothetical protein
MMHHYKLFLKELDAITLEQDRQRVLDLYPIYMNDIGQVRNVEKVREQLSPQPKPEKLFSFHDYETDSHFGVPDGVDGWNR